MMSEQRLSLDAELIASARDGDDRARETLGRGVGHLAFVFAIQMTRNHETASDVAQDTVLKFFNNLDKFDSTRPIEPWLFQIARNRVRDLARRQQHRQHESLDAWLEQGRPEHRDTRIDPADEVERNELQRRIWESVSLMSDHHREIFILRDFHGLSYREIAEVLSIPAGTVMSRLHAARTHLRTLLSGHEGEQHPDQPTAEERNKP